MVSSHASSLWVSDVRGGPGKLDNDLRYIPNTKGYGYGAEAAEVNGSIQGTGSAGGAAWRPDGARDRGAARVAGDAGERLEEALARHGPPEIMNTDQGSQFTGSAWVTTLTEAGVRISMNGRGRCTDNISSNGSGGR